MPTSSLSPTDADRERRIDLRWALAVLLAFLGLYLATLCPTVYFGDSGEIATAIWSGGIIHPPGYPLFGLLGRAFLVAVPFGEAAFRIGCLVALAGAGTVATLFLLARSAGAGRGGALAAAAVYGLGYTFWSQTVRVEVYSLHTLLCAGALLGAARYRRDGRPRSLLLAALAFGLGLGHHLTIVWLLPGLLLLCGKRLWTDPGAPARVAVAALVVLGTGPLLYAALLPLWARDETLHNWGDPSTPARLWDHVSAKMYRQYVQLPVGALLPPALARAAGALRGGFPLGLAPFLAAGIAILWRRDRGIAAALLVATVPLGLYNLCYTIDDIAGYYLPVLLGAAVFVAVALEAAATRLARVGGGRALAGATLAIAPAMLLVVNHPRCDLSRATFVREFARQKLEDCLPGSVLITKGDQDTYPVDYVHEVLGVRPDILTLDRDYVNGMWVNYAWDSSLWYLRRLRRLGVDAPIDVPATAAERIALGSGPYLRGLFEGPLRGRPVAVTFLSVSARTPAGRAAERDWIDWVGRTRQPAPNGLVVHLHPKEHSPSLATLLARNRAIWDRRDLPEIGALRTDQELDPDYLINHYATMLSNYANLYDLSGRPEAARQVYAVIDAFAPDSPIARERRRPQVSAR